MKCTALRLVGGVGCPQCRALLADLARALTVRLHSVSSGLGPGCPHRCRHAFGACLDVHRSDSQRGEWVSTADIHIDENVLLRSVARLQRSNTRGRGWVCRLDRCAGTRVPGNRGLAFIVEIHWVASGLVGWTGTQEPACCAIAGSGSLWTYTGSRAGWSAGLARRYTHVTQSRARAHRGNTLGRERVARPDRHAGTRMLRIRGLGLTFETHWIVSELIGRTGTQEPACCTIAGSRSLWKYTRSRADLSAGLAR